MYLWILLVLISGILLGFWDITKKKALEKNSIVSVLAFYSLFCFIFVSFEFNNAINMDKGKIFAVFIKSFIIFLSWTLNFTAIKNLPISVITPFDTLNPLFSIILGILVLNEKLAPFQALGILIMLISYYFIGKVGSKEVVKIFNNKYFYFMIFSSALSAVSATIDKIVLKSANPGQMQFWFCLFITMFYMSAFLFERLKGKDRSPVKIDFFIPLMSLILIVSDRLYFTALNIPASEISIVMPLRKISVFVSVIVGGLIFKEKNLKKKFWYICLLIVGIGLLFA